ncbi:hypothetical protein H7U34_06650 [Collinsella tanakaei]|nr:hypothetical protein [Collinsella tanakaei]
MHVIDDRRPFPSMLSNVPDAVYLALAVGYLAQVCVGLVNLSGQDLFLSGFVAWSIDLDFPAYHVVVRLTALLVCTLWWRSYRVRTWGSASATRLFVYVLLSAAHIGSALTAACCMVAVTGILRVLTLGVLVCDVVTIAKGRGPRFLMTAATTLFIGLFVLLLLGGMSAYYVVGFGFACRAISIGAGRRRAQPLDGQIRYVLHVPDIMLRSLPLLMLCAAYGEVAHAVNATAQMPWGAESHPYLFIVLRALLVVMPMTLSSRYWHVEVDGASVLRTFCCVAVWTFGIEVARFCGGHDAALVHAALSLVTVAMMRLAVHGESDGIDAPAVARALILLPVYSVAAMLLTSALYAATTRDILSCGIVFLALYAIGMLALRRRSDGCVDDPDHVEGTAGPDGEGADGSRVQWMRENWALSSGEARVLSCIGDGQSLAATARSLGLAKSTVASYASRAYVKLGVKNRAEAIDKMTRDIPQDAVSLYIEDRTPEWHKGASKNLVSPRETLVPENTTRVGQALSAAAVIALAVSWLAAAMRVVSLQGASYFRAIAEQVPVGLMLLVIACSIFGRDFVSAKRAGGKIITGDSAGRFRLMGCFGCCLLLCLVVWVLLLPEDRPLDTQDAVRNLFDISHVRSGISLLAALVSIALIGFHATFVIRTNALVLRHACWAWIASIPSAFIALLIAGALGASDMFVSVACIALSGMCSIAARLIACGGIDSVQGGIDCADKTASPTGSMPCRLTEWKRIDALRQFALLACGMWEGCVGLAIARGGVPFRSDIGSLLVACVIGLMTRIVMLLLQGRLAQTSLLRTRPALVSLLAVPCALIFLGASGGFIDAFGWGIISIAMMGAVLQGALAFESMPQGAGRAVMLPMLIPLLVGVAASPFATLVLGWFAGSAGNAVYVLFSLAVPMGCWALVSLLREEGVRSDLVRRGRAALVEIAQQAGLSRAEAEVAVSYASGTRTNGIASDRFVSKNTVKSQLRSAYRTLGVHSRNQLAEALLYMVEQGRR